MQTLTLPSIAARMAAPSPAPEVRGPVHWPLKPLPLRPQLPRRERPGPRPEEAFANAAEAWFWTVGALRARRDGARGNGAGVPRPCDSDDIIRALDLLHRRGGIDLAHARVLRRWGERGRAPEATRPAERMDSVLWAEALDRLDGVLRAKRLVVTVNGNFYP